MNESMANLFKDVSRFRGSVNCLLNPWKMIVYVWATTHQFIQIIDKKVELVAQMIMI